MIRSIEIMKDKEIMWVQSCLNLSVIQTSSISIVIIGIMIRSILGLWFGQFFIMILSIVIMISWIGSKILSIEICFHIHAESRRAVQL